MHPILFHLPFVDWPVRMFGLFVIDAFFAAAIWGQWQVARRKDPGFAAEKDVDRTFHLFLAGLVVVRLLFLGLKILWSDLDWGVPLVGILLADYFLSAIAWVKLNSALKRHPEAAKEAEFLFNLGFWLLLMGFVGARIFWVITTPAGNAKFVDDPLIALVGIWDGGIVWYGGMILSALFGAWYLWAKGRNILGFGDIVMVGVMLALFIGRWSCFAAGDDYGSPTDSFLGVIFPDVPETQIPKEWRGIVPIHPVQLYMSLGALLVFLAAFWFLKRKRFDGQIVFLTFLLYAVDRFVVEFYRGDESRGVARITEDIQLSTSQIISILVFAVGLVFYLLLSRRAHRRGIGVRPPARA